ncbi:MULTISPECIES: HEAT repeat domain-containing protein [Streptacidiphilus]|uniref:HEAT repeat domain-containing protein n=1 Tax=Streptacidiphilus cavernicola TaxID=3342716 RepID=A0ABV6V1D6_9ACTN|nr:HEAT repeat domain-containing protein [Streptacidiphilus jeojiense]
MTSKPRRSYGSGTIAGLLTLARGACYWPDCGEPTIRMVDGEPVQNLQIAHIRAFEENGPRFDPTWSVDERNQFDNLIMLCTPHHKVIDGPRSAEFPVELLLRWKSAREADGLDALEGLGDLTKADLGEMIAEAQTELLDRLGPALDQFAKTALDARTDAAVREYLQRVVQTYSRLNLDVLGDTGRAGEQPQIGLREVFEAPRLAWDWPRHRLPERLSRDVLDRGELENGDLPGRSSPTDTTNRRGQPSQSVLDVLGSEQGRRLVVLGDPGAGKTTLTKYLALALAGGLDNPPDGLALMKGAVPIVVELRRVADPRWIGRTIEDYWAEHNAAQRMGLPREALETLLGQGQHPVVMVFDGLDEVFDPARRADIAKHITAFSQGHPHVRTVVTSRSVGFQEGEFTRADFRVAKLEDLTRPQITSFIGRWYTAADPDSPAEAARLARRLTDAVRDFPSVAELAGNPLLLTILAAIGLGSSIPRDRRDVYEHAVEVLAGRWDRDAKNLRLPRHAHPDVAHAIDELDGRTLQDLLECIAARVQEGQQGPGGTSDAAGPLIDVGDLEQMIRDFVLNLGYATPVARTVARAMIERLYERAFLIHPFGAQTYGFVHRIFLEYLAARDLSHRYRQWDEEQLIDMLAERAVDPGWREVVLLFLGMVSRDAEALHARFVARLLRMHRRAGSAPHFRTAGDTEFLDLALQALAEAHRIGRAPSHSALTPEQAESSLPVQSDAVIDEITALLGALPGVTFPRAVTVLPTFPGSWSGRERFRRWYLPHVVLGDRVSLTATGLALAMCRDVREAITLAGVTWNETGASVMRALGARWAHEAGVRETVLTLAVSEDAATELRAEALRVLGENFGEDADTRRLLIETASVVGSHPQIRGSALVMLAKHCSAAPDCRRIVLAVANNPEAEPGVRSRVLGALARYWTRDSAAHRAVFRATSDRSAEVRSGAWNALTQSGVTGEDLRRGALTAITAQDAQERLAAMRLLGSWWSHDEEVRGAVLASAIGNPDDQALLHTLGEYWGEDREVRTLLLDVARDSSRPQHVRGAACWVLSEHWRDDEEVRQLLLFLAREGEAEVRSKVMEALSEGWESDDEVRRTMIAAANESGIELHWFAMELAGFSWPGDPGIRQALLAAVHDENSGIRWFAIETLAQRWPQDEDVRQVVLASVADQEEVVRRTAVKALGDQWPHDREARQSVLAAIGDSHPYVRSDALEVAGDRWPSDDEVRRLAQEASHDPEPLVAVTALRVLVQRWPLDDETHAAVVRSLDGPEQIDALRLLALVWPEHSETVSAIQQVREKDPTTHTATSQLLSLVAASGSSSGASARD